MKITILLSGLVLFSNIYSLNKNNFSGRLGIVSSGMTICYLLDCAKNEYEFIKIKEFVIVVLPILTKNIIKIAIYSELDLIYWDVFLQFYLP